MRLLARRSRELATGAGHATPALKGTRRRLGLADTSAITMLADGAKWLWEECRKPLTQADGVLDICHILEHITTAGQALHAAPDEATSWRSAQPARRS